MVAQTGCLRLARFQQGKLKTLTTRNADGCRKDLVVEVFQTRQEDRCCRRLTLAGGREWEVNQTDGSERTPASLDGCGCAGRAATVFSRVWQARAACTGWRCWMHGTGQSRPGQQRGARAMEAPA